MERIIKDGPVGPFTLPAIKKVPVVKGAKTVVHIGWKTETNKPFCLCGQEATTEANYKRDTHTHEIDLSWKPAHYHEFKEITCKRCLEVWNNNRRREGDIAPARDYVFQRLEREHKSNTSYRYYLGKSSINEKASAQIPSKDSYHRRLKSGLLLLGVKSMNGHIHIGFTNHPTHPNFAQAVCNHNISGPAISEYYPHSWITCPDCIKYIKDNDLDVTKEVMLERKRKLESLQVIAKEYAERLDETNKSMEQLRKSILI